MARFNFPRDIMRLESVVLDKERIAGYSLILTNMASFLREGDGSRRNAEFHLDQGIPHGKREWRKDSSNKTRGRTSDSVTKKGYYSSNWFGDRSLPKIVGSKTSTY